MAKNIISGDLLRSGSSKTEPVDHKDATSFHAGAELGLTRMARQKAEISTQVSGTVSEMERLRMRQDALEKEKDQLQDLARRQEIYEQNKRDLMEKLARSVILLEKEEHQAMRMSELLAETRERFKDALAEMKQVNEEEWPDEQFKEELDQALALVDSAKNVYRKAMARIEASSWHKTSSRGERLEPLEAARLDHVVDRSFGFWFKAGLAATLPLIIVLVLGVVVYFLWLNRYI